MNERISFDETPYFATAVIKPKRDISFEFKRFPVNAK